jgi:hypothetical protein
MEGVVIDNVVDERLCNISRYYPSSTYFHLPSFQLFDTSRYSRVSTGFTGTVSCPSPQNLGFWTVFHHCIRLIVQSYRRRPRPDLEGVLRDTFNTFKFVCCKHSLPYCICIILVSPPPRSRHQSIVSIMIPTRPASDDGRPAGGTARIYWIKTPRKVQWATDESVPGPSSWTHALDEHGLDVSSDPSYHHATPFYLQIIFAMGNLR